MKRIKPLLLVTALIVMLLSPRHLSATPNPTIPLDEGTEWNYFARVSWPAVNANHERSASIQWRTRVVKSFKTAKAIAAVVSGFPAELTGYEPGKAPGYSVLVETESGLYEISAASEPEAEELANKASAGEKQVRELTEKAAAAGLVGDQLLRFPVRVGDCLDADDPKRTDGMYCWFVQERVKDARGPAWVLTYRTAPDEMTFHIVPGIGVTQFFYDHHGTINSADARLTGFYDRVHR